jgi:hypothetical protein
MVLVDLSKSEHMVPISTWANLNCCLSSSVDTEDVLEGRKWALSFWTSVVMSELVILGDSWVTSVWAWDWASMVLSSCQSGLTAVT